MKNPQFQFIFVKPKAVALNLTETFFKEFEKKGLTIVWRKRVRLTREQIEFLYRPYRYVHWFEDFAEVMTSGDSVLALLMGGDDVIELSFEVRERMREKYKHLVEFYDLHTADSEKTAISQLKFLIGRKVYDIIKSTCKQQRKEGGDMLDKKKFLQACISIHEEKIRNLEESLAKIRNGAIDAVPSMVSWSDTTKFQLSNLALGVQKRLEEAKLSLIQLKQLSPTINNTICVGSFFSLKEENTEEIKHYLLIPAGGGDYFEFEGRKILSISPNAPLAKALIGKKNGDKVSFRDIILEVISVQ